MYECEKVDIFIKINMIILLLKDFNVVSLNKNFVEKSF